MCAYLSRNLFICCCFFLSILFRSKFYFFYDRKQLKEKRLTYLLLSIFIWTMQKPIFDLSICLEIFLAVVWLNPFLMLMIQCLEKWQNLTVTDQAKMVWPILGRFLNTMLTFHVRPKQRSVNYWVQLMMKSQLVKHVHLHHLLGLIHPLIENCSNRLPILRIKISNWMNNKIAFDSTSRKNYQKYHQKQWKVHRTIAICYS